MTLVSMVKTYKSSNCIALLLVFGATPEVAAQLPDDFSNAPIIQTDTEAFCSTTQPMKLVHEISQ
jgi:hypothetical protein